MKVYTLNTYILNLLVIAKDEKIFKKETYPW